MSKNLHPLRPGLTAIAAVLALSATPAFAQDTTAAAPQAAPVISAPPAPTPAPAPEASPAPVQSTATDTSAAPVATAPAAAPAATMATQSTPVVHQPDAADTAPVAKAASAPARVKTVSTKTSEIKTAAATPAPAPVAAPKAAEPAAAPAPVAQAETPAPVAPAPVAKTSTTTQTSTTSNDNREIELAGIGGVALLAIIGGAVAFTRRKRDDEDELALTPATVTTSRVIEETPVYEPVTAAPVTAVAAPRADYIDAPTTALHPDFDLSRYGQHVQMAYQGPTEDNPSLSLRHRLKRARFMDQRARENGEYVAPIAAETSTAKERKPVTQNMISARLKQGLRAVRPQGNMRPAFG